MQHRGTEELTTKRLRLRRYARQDARAIFDNYAADEEVTRFLSWPPYASVEGVERFLEARITEYARPDVYHWAIEYGGQVVGSISVNGLDERNRSCELGYCISRACWNKGLMSEAVAAAMAFLFTQVGAHRIWAKHDPENPASGRVMLRCGMRPEGRLRGHYCRRDGSFADALVYGALAEDARPQP